MMKKLRLTFAFVASLLAGLALPQAGSAQFFDRPQFLEPVLPIDEILFAVEARGFEPISRPRLSLSGDVYVVEVIDRRGRRTRLSVDAFDGMILGSVRPRGVLPDPVYRDARPVAPFGGRPLFRDGYEERYVPDRGVRDLRDPSTRGSSVRIETVPVRRDRPRVSPALPEAGPLPPPRPPEVAMAPATGMAPALAPTLPPASERAAPVQPQSPEPAALPRDEVIPQVEAAPQTETLPLAQEQETQASEAVREPAPRPAQPERQAQRQTPRQVEREPRARTRSLLDDFSPDERDQLDMYLPGPQSR